MYRRYFSAWMVPCLMAAAAVMMAGCTASVREINPNDVQPYDASYDVSAKKDIVEGLVQSLANRSPLAARNDRPVVVIYNVANQTSEHISTDGITDDIRQELLRSGRARFVGKTQRDSIEKELAYQYGGNVSPGTRVQQARQVGAEYMITGTLREIKKREPRQVRLTRKTMRYYSLTLELTNLETGLIDWTDSVEIVRESSKPFIGW